ncbi:MAG: methyltransferase domain-containing protein [Myxococcota bacterium]|nr:methyltransferase domain-containing protein [Myxococcota bacterium]
MTSLERFRLQPDRRLAFFQGFLRHPKTVGSIIPSSRFLERRVVQAADVGRARTVVELGPGTGGTTRALLRAMAPDATLLCVEINPDFVRILRSIRDARVVVHQGSAAELPAILTSLGLPAPEVVVSGIPFSTMPEAVGLAVLEGAWEALAPGGAFVAYQVRDRVETLGRRVMGPAQVQRELRNVPPMRVYRWGKPAVAPAAAAASSLGASAEPTV